MDNEEKILSFMKAHDIPINDNYLSCEKGSPPAIRTLFSMDNARNWELFIQRPYLIFFTPTEIIFYRLRGRVPLKQFKANDLARYTYDEIEKLTVLFPRPIDRLLQVEIAGKTHYFYFQKDENNFNEENFNSLAARGFLNWNGTTSAPPVKKVWWRWLSLLYFIVVACLTVFVLVPQQLVTNAVAILLFATISVLFAVFPPQKQQRVSLLAFLLSFTFLVLSIW